MGAFDLFLIVIILFLLFLLSMVWPPDSPWAPWWRTSRKIAESAFRMAKVSEKDIIYELGSGEGVALITGVKKFGAKGVGIEIDPLRYLLSKVLIRKEGLGDKIKIYRGNFFDYDISKASVVFVYLVPKALQKLVPKFKKELRKGTRIISYKYEIDLPLMSYDKKTDIRLYEV